MKSLKYFSGLLTKLFVIAILSCANLYNFAQSPWDHGKLKVSSIKHYIIHEDGTPFFWIGDTEWILNKCSYDIIQEYLANRKTKGFTLIQVFLTRNWNDEEGWARTDYKGNLPFLDNNPTKFDSSYFDRWSEIIDLAAARDLYIALHIGEPIRNDVQWELTDTNQAYEYGRLLGNYFKNKPNIIYNLGQDFYPDASNSLGIEYIDAVAEGVADGVNGINTFNNTADYSSTFMTYHPNGDSESSSTWLHNKDWLDANAIQTWDTVYNCYDSIHADYEKSPVKPIILVETAYENRSARVNAYRNRQDAYHTYFAGGAGHTYGFHDHWTKGYDVIENLNSDGANSMAILADFFKSIEWRKLIPEQSIIYSGENSGRQRKAALNDSTYGNEFYVYFPEHDSAQINLNSITATNLVIVKWFDPRNGNTQTEGEGVFYSSDIIDVSPPDGWEDAILIVKATRVKNAFTRIEAETADEHYGINTNENDISNFCNGYWAKYDSVDFGNGADSVDINLGVTSEYAGKQLDLKIDSVNGQLIGSLITTATSGWQDYTIQSTTISDASGVHDLYVIGNGSCGIANIDWFQFDRTSY